MCWGITKEPGSKSQSRAFRLFLGVGLLFVRRLRPSRPSQFHRPVLWDLPDETAVTLPTERRRVGQGALWRVPNVSRMSKDLPSETEGNTLSHRQVVAIALLGGLLSFGCFYHTGRQLAGETSIPVAAVATPESVAVHLAP